MVDWDACLAAASPVALGGTLYRLVESQEQVATRQLVSSLARQAVLEDLLEATKPPPREGSGKLHYLLATPFRYPPLPFGSRFGTRQEPSLFYGSQTTATVLAESAYYRLLFWQGMAEAPPEKLDTQHTLFGAKYRTTKGLQLQRPPFAAHRAVLTSPTRYAPTQALGAKMRAAGIQLFEFVSARDPDGGTNVALFTPAAFAAKNPVSQESWLCELNGEGVRFYAPHSSAIHDFPAALFMVDGELPQPA